MFQQGLLRKTPLRRKAIEFLEELFKASIKVSDESLIRLSKMADETLKKIKAERSAACGVLEGKGVKLYNYSLKEGLPPGVFPEYKHALVDKWVKDMWKLSKEGKIKKLPHHYGKCAEIMNIDEYLHSIDPLGNIKTLAQAQKAFEGFVSHVRQIDDLKKKGIIITKHKDYKKACDSCIDLLKDFGINEYKII